MGAFAIKSDHLLLPGGIDGAGYVTVTEEGTFGAVSASQPAGLRIIDRTGTWVAPGFVDTHIHGFMGHDVMDCDAEGINVLCAELACHGTTSWLATTLTASVEETERACASVARAQSLRGSDYLGTRIQGIFLEGPFFVESKKGAQNPAYLIDPSYEAFARWQKAAGGLIRKTALAAERPGADAYISRVVSEGVVAAIGHSNASYAKSAEAVLAGATVFVHTYNAMSGLNHREPGVVGCALTSDGTYAELISDGLHVDPVACEVLVRAKGWRHVALVTDCLSCGGLPEGNYHIGELPIELRDGAAYLSESGNLAGSILTLDQAVRNVVAWGIVTAEQALRMASEVPAYSCGIEGSCGSIIPGRAADLVVLDYGDLSLVETYIGGCKVS